MDMLDKKPAEALKRYEAVLARDRTNTLALIASAALREQMGAKSEEVGALLDEAAKANPEDQMPRLAKIDFLLNSRQAKAALAVAQDTNAQFRDSPLALDALGRVQMAAGDLKQAIATFRKVALLDSASDLPYLRLAEAYVIVKDYPAARQNFVKALEIRPGQLGVHRRLIQLAILDKRVDEAIRIARVVQRELPTDSVGVLLEAEIQVGQRNWDAAIGVLQGALARGADTEVAKRLVVTYQAAKRPEAAVAFGDRWQRDHPRDADFTFYLGASALERNDMASAEAYFRRTLALMPDHAPSANNVAWLLLEQKKPGALAFAQAMKRYPAVHHNTLRTVVTA